MCCAPPSASSTQTGNPPASNALWSRTQERVARPDDEGSDAARNSVAVQQALNAALLDYAR